MSTISLCRTLPFVSCLLVTFGATANETQDVLKAFSKMEARVETGMNFRDYSNAIGDLNFEFKSYLESSDPAKEQEMKKVLTIAMVRYMEAGTLWGLHFSARMEYLFPRTDLYKTVVAQYPDAAKDYNHGGAAIPGTVGEAYTGALVIDMLLPMYWRDAATNVDAAKALAARGK